MKARTVKHRVDQVIAWLAEERPCGRKVEVLWVNWTSKENNRTFGETVRNGDVLQIKLSGRKCRTRDHAIETLLHEYAHCRLWGPAKSEHSDKIEHHDPAFWAEFGIIYNMYHYGTGWRDSEEYEY